MPEAVAAPEGVAAAGLDAATGRAWDGAAACGAGTGADVDGGAEGAAGDDTARAVSAGPAFAATGTVWTPDRGIGRRPSTDGAATPAADERSSTPTGGREASGTWRGRICSPMRTALRGVSGPGSARAACGRPAALTGAGAAAATPTARDRRIMRCSTTPGRSGWPNDTVRADGSADEPATAAAPATAAGPADGPTPAPATERLDAPTRGAAAPATEPPIDPAGPGGVVTGAAPRAGADADTALPSRAGDSAAG